jgi:hypothetical protein
VEGATTSRVFKTYVERLLAPALQPGSGCGYGQSLGAHRLKRIKGSSKRGAANSSTYRPTLRTIEPDKGSPLEDKAPPKEDRCPHQGGADLEAMGRALAAVSARDVQGFFANCGYRAPAQHL